VLLIETPDPTKFSPILGDAMRTINIHAAKTQLSRLVDAAAAGEEIIIAKSGKPIARLGPLSGPRRRRTLGVLAGRLRLPEDFDADLPEEVLDAFEGR
jgi:prevent-host-death family protein